MLDTEIHKDFTQSYTKFKGYFLCVTSFSLRNFVSKKIIKKSFSYLNKATLRTLEVALNWTTYPLTT